ncbi:hypothetical protein FSP39_008438 [Pinctada imbricata]|uniref:PH domain-containing protein n=1 Tax=Pinctada imbricata TaxID=66713 RepID=A0AA89BKF5_PINIB|nr:hypothetical protein FSP39_008438 [Pinctada imbricata]
MSVPEEIYSGIENKVTIKHGYVKMKSRQLGGFWKKRYIVLYSPSSMGPSRLVKYNDKNDANRGEKCLSEIMMADVGTVVRMASEDSKHGITLNMPTEVRQFLCDDEVDCCDWLQKLKAETGKMDVLPQGVFRVFLIPSAQLNYSGECCLHIHSEMFLLSENPDKSDPIVEWNIKYIRRYAVDESKKLLKIENGRYH